MGRQGAAAQLQVAIFRFLWIEAVVAFLLLKTKEPSARL
jgi:hypothetical protein